MLQNNRKYLDACVRAAVCFGATSLLAASARGTTFTWDGGATGAGSLNWGTTANWTNSTPTSSTGTDLIFAGTTNIGSSGNPLSQNIATPMILNSITFASGAGSFFLSGNQIRFGGASSGIFQNSSSAISIANTVDLNTATTFGGSGTGIVSFSSAFTGAAALTISAGTFQLDANSSSYAQTVTLQSGATLRTQPIAGTGNYNPFGTGALSLTSASLVLNGASDNGTDSNALLGATTLDGANTLRIDNIGTGNSTTRVTAASLGRASGKKGTLIINDGGGVLGSSGNQGERLLVTTGAPTATNGMVSPYYVRISGSGTDGDFVTYGANGFAPSTGSYVAMPAGAGAGTEIVNVGTVTSVTANKNIYALRTGFNLTQTGGPFTLTVRSGGLIINDNSTISPGMFFGPSPTTAEAAIFVASGATGTINGSVSATDLTKFGAGSLELAGSNSISGEINVNSGRLRFAATGAQSSTAWKIQAFSTLDLNATGAASFTNAISGAGNFIKSGSSTLTLSGASTYTGTTNISAGALIVNNTHSGGDAYSMSSTATLGGTGTITLAANKSFTLSGTLSPGAVSGSTRIETLGLTTSGTGNTVLPAGGTYVWEINNQNGSAGVNWDQVALQGVSVTATNSPGSKFIIKIVSLTAANVAGAMTEGAGQAWNPNVFKRWTIATFTGSGITSAILDRFQLDTTGFANTNVSGFYLEVSGGNLDITYVPEPGTGVLLIGAIAMTRRIRRRL